MIRINNKALCENCFGITEQQTCPYCGYNAKRAAVIDTVLPPGTVLNGRYVVGRVLGQGGFGITYLGYNVIEDKMVAIKEHFPKNLVHRRPYGTDVLLSTQEQVPVFKKGMEAFFKEATTLSQLNSNPNIVSVYAFFYENGTAYFAMEYLQGKDLRRYISDRGRALDNKETRDMIVTVATALSDAHKQNFLHRDISNVNVFVCNDGRYKLIDFGAARQFSMEYAVGMSVTHNPPRYAGFAPLEQHLRHGKQGPWSDIYALGATAYWALIGQHLDDPMTRLSNDNLVNIKGTDIDTELYRIICKCIKVNERKRYQSAQELLDELKSGSESNFIARLFRR